MFAVTFLLMSDTGLLVILHVTTYLEEELPLRQPLRVSIFVVLRVTVFGHLSFTTSPRLSMSSAPSTRLAVRKPVQRSGYAFSHSSWVGV